MKNLLFLILVLFTSNFSKAQTIAYFEKDFEHVVNNNFLNQDIDSLYKKYNHILFWFNPNSRLAANMQGLETASYPLQGFKESLIYQKNINTLLADTAVRKYTLGCLLVGATNDTTKRVQVENILINNKYKNFWAATILTYLQPNNLQPILRCIINYNNDNGVSYLISDFLKIDEKVLDKFGQDSLFSQEPIIQMLAIKALSKTPNNTVKEKALKQVVLKTDTAMKGWAIAVLAHLQADNMLHVVKPYLENKDLYQVCIRAIAGSNSIEDVMFIDSLISKGNYDNDFLNGLLNSENETSIRKWLDIFRENKLPADYYINVMQNASLKEDKYFSALCEIVENHKNESQLDLLMFCFDNKRDKQREEYLRKCLSHPFKSVRDRAEQFLRKYQ